MAAQTTAESSNRMRPGRPSAATPIRLPATRIGSTFPNWPLPRNATPVPTQTAIQTTTDPIQ
jgi:hypothetical protein